MSKGRGSVSTIFRNLLNSLKPSQNSGTLIGKDQHGTLYYEIVHKQPGRRPSRWFEPNDKENFEQELPAEWESWLRFRRKDPPSEKEVLANAALALTKKSNAAKLAAQQNVTLDKNDMQSFPQYSEYEVTPGVQKKKVG